MTSKETSSTDEAQQQLPFGALPDGSSASSKTAKKKPARKKKTVRKKAPRAEKDAEAASAAQPGPSSPAPSSEGPPEATEGSTEDGAPSKRRRTRRGRRKRRSRDGDHPEGGTEGAEARSSQPATDAPEGGQSAPSDEGDGGGRPRRRRRRRGKKPGDGGGQTSLTDDGAERTDDGGGERTREEKTPATGTGMFVLDKGNVSVLRLAENGYLASKDDIYVPKKLVQRYKLRDGMMCTGPISRGYKHKHQLDDVREIDGHPPKYWANKPLFKNLTSVDPDFHYAVGDIVDDVSMRVVDLISPIGRGQRGLLVAPPRTGKTTLLRQFAKGIEDGYPDVHLMVLLIDERPEEATEWKRSVERGEVFVSTADETSKHHIQVAEIVWKRAMRMVEMGEDVVLLLDSITRLARAYNNQAGSGRTMSGGLDSRAMERPRKIFGSARNTVEAGSLTIIGTTLVETGSRMDQLVFEEFKGTGNMELVLNRKLADRRIFPAIDIEKSGTRKEEKLVGLRRLKLIHVLRRVLARMHFAEAAELLITRLDDVEKTDDFLERFTVDPEA
ncbi:MAG: transcription termination factor Rho [Planctomycetota bacterium]